MVEQPILAPAGDLKDFIEIINLFKSRKIGTYISKFKILIGNVRQQPDAIFKVIMFCLGMLEFFQE